MNMQRIEDFWLFKKHINNIEILDFGYIELIKKIKDRLRIEVARTDNADNTRLQWQKIENASYFFYDFRGSEEEIKAMLLSSKLINSTNVYIETRADMPIIMTSSQYFANHWYDLTCSIMGMGSIVVSQDYEYLMEFCDDSSYMLYSNFKIR